MVRSKLFLLITILSISAILLGACTSKAKPEGTLTAAELLKNPVYDTEVKIYGKVSGLGEFACRCFILASGGETVTVWYDTMVENDGTLRTPVNVKGINNGDKVIVTGELKGEGGIHYAKGDFWAAIITKVLP